MIIVHDIFVCKPGNASKLAKIFKESMQGATHPVQVMTDLTGQYNRVILVSTFDGLAAYEENMKAYANPTPEMKAGMEKMAGYQDMYLTGSREIYRAV